MSIFNGNSLFLSKKSKTMPVVKVPKNVKQSLQIDRAFENGIFKIEPKEKMAVYDRCYIFEDINYINKNIGEQKDFLMNLMFWLNSMDVEFKITLANEYQSMDEFLASIRAEKNKAEYPDIAKGIRQWQDERIKETNPNVTTLRYLTGVDAQSLAAIQEFSAKEFKALSSGNVGEGVMVWNKKVVMFDALISKENVLYKNYSTNFHEKAKEQKRLSFEEEVVPNFGTKEKTEPRSVLSKKEEELILEVACIMDITVTDVERLFNQDTETCLGYLKLLEEKGELREVNGRYRRVG